jgi:hypothetical protein
VIGSVSVQTKGKWIQICRLSDSLATFNIHNWFVSVYFAVSDLQVEVAIRIGTDPCLVMHSCSLTAKIR